jgi:hypothetical protein
VAGIWCWARPEVPSVGFELGSYDTAATLVIDPVIVYAAQIGDAGSGGNEEALSIEVDEVGNAFVTGFTTSPDFPVTPGAFETSKGGLYDAFVLKLDPLGDIEWATFLGGSGDEQGRGLDIDGRGAVYVTGVTNSGNFPTKRAVQGRLAGEFDAFVSKLSPSGSGLSYSTYLGGSSFENSDGADFLFRQGVGDIAVDGLGRAYITGSTQSGDFPTENPIQAQNGGGTCPPGVELCHDVFVTGLDRSGSAITYSTYLGGSGSERGYGIEVTGTGSAFVSGEAISIDWPTTRNAFQRKSPGGNDYIAARISPTGSRLVYATYLGGEGTEFAGSEMAIDADGNAFITGATFSFSFPTTPGAYQRQKEGDLEATVSKLDPRGAGLVYSTYVGGLDDEGGSGIDVDEDGNAWFTGFTTSGGTHPEVDELEPCSAAEEATVTELDAAGARVLFSTCLGTLAHEGISISVIPGSAFMAGFTLSGGGATDAEVIRIDESIGGRADGQPT